MTETTRKPSTLDPAWIALGAAGAVLLAALLWLTLGREAPAPRVEAPAAPTAAAPSTAPNGAPPGAAPAVATLAPAAAPDRLALLEERLRTLEARPEADPARLEALERRGAEATQAIAELRAATGSVLREAGDALAQRFGQLDAGIRAALEAAEARLGAQERAMATLAQQLPAALATLEQRERAAREALEGVRAESARGLAALREEAAPRAALDAARAETARALETLRAEATQREAAARQLLENAAAEARRAQEALGAEIRRVTEASAAATRAAQEEAARRIAAIEARVVQAQQRGERIAAVAAARGLLDAGRPLSPALPRLGDALPAELQRFALAAPPTEAGLRARFEEAVREARARVTPTDTLGRLSSVLTIRRGEEVVFGDAAEAVIERARRALDAADLEGALAQLATLPEGTRQALRPWTEEAQSLLAARGALRRLGEG
ncbi:hypothetical protein ACI6QG_12350 [Roseococcus sp. DSY-14]|uniref:hypothetical protein n=1 Tax=Roseococcus sp. DSY-14 TaxID=3369650 RepID=UPI00387B1BBB